MKKSLLFILFSFNLFAVYSQCEANFTVSTTGENTSDFIQDYVAVNSSGDIVEINQDGIFDGLPAGTYDVYALNYDDGISWTALSIGTDWSAVITEWSTAPYCADTIHTQRTVCIPYVVCEGTPINGVSDINSNTYSHDNLHYSGLGYTQEYVLLNNPPDRILAVNTSPDFSYTDYGDVANDADFLIYAINYDASDDDFTTEYDGSPFGVLDVLDPWSEVLTAVSTSCADLSEPLYSTVLEINNSTCASTTPAEGLVLSGEVLTYSNQLNWYSESEENTSYHILMRADKSGVFEDVLMLDAVGNSNSKTYYSDFDVNPINEAYYKIRVEDVDGTLSYSNTILLNRELDTDINFNLVPNPAEDIVNIKFGNSANQDVNVEIYNAIGQLLYHKYLDANNELSSIEVDLSSFASGTYNVMVKNNNKSVVKRLVKI